jgi:hypothetical protein
MYHAGKSFLFSVMKYTLLALALCTGLATTAVADVEDRLYDFTDAFYMQKGVDPALIAGRAQANGVNWVNSPPIHWFQRNVRALRTTGGWDDGGDPIFFTVTGGLSVNSFTNNSAGRQAMDLADRSAEYIFPMRGTNPLGLGAPRQPFMLDRSGGYFSNNPLGLWIHVFVNYTDAAFNTRGGQKELRQLVSRNGYAMDGTPAIRTKSEIENLYQKGYVTKLLLPPESPIRYGICPAIKDPTDGGIAIDQFLSTVRRSNGQAFDPFIEQSFESLRMFGRWP